MQRKLETAHTLQDILIANRYRVDRKLGAGGFGLVYSGIALSLPASLCSSCR